ncbi:quinon protein alcohol dehydrogenase-like superfamily [Phyllosticta citrichinensis]|uniref:ASTRA-associated protein 1 n=1 Tax=Phyllosticta citrichinensis TaxID=1130410 RepID=A0ABR1XP56_9PEZI
MSKPATPVYVLRGHAAPIHAVRFVRRNSRLLTGDADGWLVVWNLASKRPAAVWRPHSATILGLDADQDRIITHGRDSHLRVWQLRPDDEAALDTVLPVDNADVHRKQPWLLHSIPVNTLNFCPFAICRVDNDNNDDDDDDSTLVAVPGVLDGQIAVHGLPSERRFSTVPKTELQTGMVMALALVPGPQLRLMAGYESGLTVVFAHDATSGSWTRTYASTPHTQPLLSLCPLPGPPDGPLTYFSSGADDVVAKHVVSPTLPPASMPKPPSISKPPPVKTKHAGQQSLAVRSDGRLLATAGWDGRARVYSTRTLREMAVLKWHAEGCYAVGFGDVLDGDERDEDGGQGALAHVRRRREERVAGVHWVAAGSKDGKVSLWDVY